MTTLYDLLGALPGDDADDLRDAFRRAVKDVHPDIRPNDPDAALNFRLIVYAMEVLRDPEQRAAYDYLLELARRELVSQRRAAKIRTFAFAMIGLASFSVVVIGAGSLLAPALLPRFKQIDETSRAPTKTEPSSNSPGPASNDNGAAANPNPASTKPAEEQNDFLTRWGPNDIDARAGPMAGTGPPATKQDDLPPPSDAHDNDPPADRNSTGTATKEQESPVVRPPDPNLPERRDATDEVRARSAPSPTTDTSAVMHAKGVVAYRKGDLDAALADLSRAIELDPTFMLAYIDRGIVLYRMGKLDLALADVARAKRIDQARHHKPVATLHGRRRRDTSATDSPASMQAAGL